MLKTRFMSHTLLAVCLILPSLSVSVFAADVEALSKEINSEIRQAERMMFGGKNEEADALLQGAREKLNELSSLDSEHRSLKSLQSKFDRIRKQVDKKLGKDASTKPASADASEPAAEKPSTPKKTTSTSSSGSSSDRYKLQMQERALKKIVKDVDYALGRAMSCLEPEGYGVTPSSASSKVQEAMGYIERARDQLKKFEEKYPDLSKDSTVLAASESIDAKVAEIESWKTGQLALEAEEAASAASIAADTASAIAKMQSDAALIVTLYETYYPEFEKISGGSMIHGMENPQIEQGLSLLESAETSIPLFADKLGKLADVYGSNSMDIYNTMHRRGYTPEHGEEIKMEQLLQAVEKVKAARVASAETLADYAGALLGAFNGQLTDHRIKRMGEAKKLLLAGQEFDPGNGKIQEMLAEIDDQMAEVAGKMEALIDETEWKHHVQEFGGPGDVKALSASAKTFFENDRDWGKKPGKGVEILKVSVRGPWKVAETDAFGRVIQWRLPIHVAVTDNDLKERKLARVYDLSILAQEGAPGDAPQSPPFDGYWVGENWMMRLNKFDQ